MSSMRLYNPTPLSMESHHVAFRQKLVQSLSVLLSLGGDNNRKIATRGKVKGNSITLFHIINQTMNWYLNISATIQFRGTNFVISTKGLVYANHTMGNATNIQSKMDTTTLSSSSRHSDFVQNTQSNLTAMYTIYKIDNKATNPRKMWKRLVKTK